MNKFAFVAIIPILYSFTFISAGFSALTETREYIQTAEKTTATVVDLKRYVARRSVSRRKRQRTTYSVIFTFEDTNNETYTVESNERTNVTLPERGEEIEIYYKKLNPRDARINSFFFLWFGAVIEFVFSGALILLGIMIAFGKPKKRD